MLFDPIGSDKKQLNTANKSGEHEANARALACDRSNTMHTNVSARRSTHNQKSCSAHPRIPHSNNNSDNGKNISTKMRHPIDNVYNTYFFGRTPVKRINMHTLDAQSCSLSFSLFHSIFCTLSLSAWERCRTLATHYVPRRTHIMMNARHDIFTLTHSLTHHSLCTCHTCDMTHADAPNTACSAIAHSRWWNQIKQRRSPLSNQNEQYERAINRAWKHSFMFNLRQFHRCASFSYSYLLFLFTVTVFFFFCRTFIIPLYRRSVSFLPFADRFPWVWQRFAERYALRFPWLSQNSIFTGKKATKFFAVSHRWWHYLAALA